MTQKEITKLTTWLSTLKEVSEIYQGNINLSNVIRSVEARLKFYNKL